MSSHASHSLDLRERFEFPSKLKTISMVLIVLGLVGIVAGFFMYQGDESKRFWANMLLNAVFFQGVVMASGFFLAATYVAYGGWHIVLKRVPEAIAMMLPVTGIILFIVLLLGNKVLYEWTDPEAVKNDPIIAGKTAYLNLPFFFIRFIFFVGVPTLLAYMMRRDSKREDERTDLRYYKNNLKWASLFLVIYAVYILITAWDWLMSLDVHWYSTMFGWQNFASFWVSACATITLVILYLKRKNYLQAVNKNHLHEMGLLMFAFSIFWTYVTFDQFMLIWYGNIPEETEYFRQRYDHVMWLFYFNWIINFVAPFLILMSRDAKRNPRVLATAAIIILTGHFIDFYLMVMTPLLGADAGFSIMEIGTPLFFIGLFIYVVFTNLTRVSLVPRHDPFLDESLHHTI